MRRALPDSPGSVALCSRHRVGSASKLLGEATAEVAAASVVVLLLQLRQRRVMDPQQAALTGS